MCKKCVFEKIRIEKTKNGRYNNKGVMDSMDKTKSEKLSKKS